MIEGAMVMGVVELGLIGVTYAATRRQPFAGGTLFVWQASLFVAALSLACIGAAVLMTVPESRDVAIAAAIVGVGVLAVRALQRGPRVGPLRAETERVDVDEAPAGYTVRAVPSGTRSARVRRIQGMGVQ